MRYDVRLRIAYDYESPVSAGRHLLRLIPITQAGVQRVVASSLSYDPQPEEHAIYTDFFGNRVANIGYRQPQDHLKIDMQSRVHVATGRESDRGDSQPAQLTIEALAQQVGMYKSLGPESPHHFIGASPRAPADEDIIEYARRSLTAKTTVCDLVDELCRRIRDDFKYDADATEVDTPAATAFKHRHGVCQDFSHILIIGLRGIGVPASYVSGFIRTIPPPGEKRLEGADAMHAWVRVWCGETAGWIGFDPTNAMRAGVDHIVIGYGRDYTDVAPVVGILKSTGEHDTCQSVDVLPVEA